MYKRDPNTWIKIANLKGDNGKQGSTKIPRQSVPITDDNVIVT